MSRGILLLSLALGVWSTDLRAQELLSLDCHVKGTLFVKQNRVERLYWSPEDHRILVERRAYQGKMELNTVPFFVEALELDGKGGLVIAGREDYPYSHSGPGGLFRLVIRDFLLPKQTENLEIRFTTPEKTKAPAATSKSRVTCEGISLSF